MSAKLFYRLTNVLSGMVLADAGSGPLATLRVYQTPYTGDPNQQWWARVVDQEQGLLVFGSRSSGSVLIPGAPNPQGRPELVTAPEPADWLYAWNPIPVQGADGAARFVFKLYRRDGRPLGTDGDVMDLPIDEHDRDDGAHLQTFLENDGTNQQWAWEIVGDNYFASFLSANSSGHAMGLQLGALDDGYPIEQYSYRGLPNREWFLIPVDLDSGIIKFRSVATGLVVQIQDGGPTTGGSGTPLVQEPDDHQHPSDHRSLQQWKIISSHGSYKIVSEFDGRVIDVTGDSGDEGAPLQAYPDHNGDNQRWGVSSVFAGDVLDPPGGPIFSIVSKLGTFMSVDDNGWIVQQNDRGAATQKWGVVTFVDGYSNIISVADQRVVDLPLPDPQDGQQVQAYQDNGGANQQWAIVPTDEGDGWYKIICRQTGEVLDVRGNSRDERAAVQQYPDKGLNVGGNADNQRWRFVLLNG